MLIYWLVFKVREGLKLGGYTIFHVRSVFDGYESKLLVDNELVGRLGTAFLVQYDEPAFRPPNSMGMLRAPNATIWSTQT